MKRPVVKTRQLGNVTYQLEWVRCGKRRCKCCPHGPYWYAYAWHPKRGCTVSYYVGKRPPWEASVKTK